MKFYLYPGKQFIGCKAILLFMSLSFVSRAQLRTKPIIQNVYSYYTVRLPGNIRVDANGKPFPVIPDTTIVVYIETTTKLIKWEMAWKYAKTYSITSQLISYGPFKAGTVKGNGRKITLLTREGNYLWQLYLSPLQLQIKPPGAIKENELLLKGLYRHKAILEKTIDPVELEGVPSVLILKPESFILMLS